MSGRANINVDDNSGLIGDREFIAAFATGWFDINRIDGVPNVNAFISKFDSFSSHSFSLYFISDRKGINSLLLSPQVCEMRLSDFAVKLIEKVNEFISGYRARLIKGVSG